MIHRNGVSDGQMCRQRARRGLTAEEAESGRGGDRESDGEIEAWQGITWSGEKSTKGGGGEIDLVVVTAVGLVAE